MPSLTPPAACRGVSHTRKYFQLQHLCQPFPQVSRVEYIIRHLLLRWYPTAIQGHTICNTKCHDNNTNNIGDYDDGLLAHALYSHDDEMMMIGPLCAIRRLIANAAAQSRRSLQFHVIGNNRVALSPRISMPRGAAAIVFLRMMVASPRLL